MMLHYRIAMGLVCSSLGLSVALPVVAQQVVLTPGGTQFQAVRTKVQDFVLPGMDGLQREPFINYAPGTGIDGNEPILPGENRGVFITPAIPIDPDALIGGPGGTRYSDLVKSNNPDKSGPVYAPEEVAELARKGEFAYTTSSASPAPSSGNEQIARSESVNPLRLPSSPRSSGSPLSESRILPGFNQ
jgi:hypothetical protein